MKFSASGSWFDGTYAESIKLAHALGFCAVEFIGWRGENLDEAADALKRYNITNTAVFLGSRDERVNDAVSWRHGMVWEDSVPHIVTAFRETVEAAKKLAAPNIIMISGGERCDISREKQSENCINALKAVAPLAEEAGVTVVLEPLNKLVDHKGYFLNTSREAFEIIKAVDSPAVRVLFDIYHQQITEGNIIRNITENIDLVGHIHMADNPGRNEPGTGEINYPAVLEAIKKTGYDKWIAFECGSTLPLDILAEKMHALTKPFENQIIQ